MSAKAFRTACFLCRRSLRLGPGLHEGTKIPRWSITVCSPCLDINRGGLVPTLHPRLVAYFESKEIDPALNINGWFEWPRRRSSEAQPATNDLGETTMSEQQSKEWKQAEAAFAKEQSLPIRMPDDELIVSLAEVNMARQKAARLARDASQPAGKKNR